jgi:hypothetical protein
MSTPHHLDRNSTSMCRRQRSQVPPVPDNYNVSDPLRTVALLPGLPLYIINSLEVVVVVCVSTRAPSPPDPSFLHVCLLPFLNLPWLPVRLLGSACAGCEKGQL